MHRSRIEVARFIGDLLVSVGQRRIASGFFLIAIAIAVASCRPTHPTDEQLLNVFKSNRVRFDELRDMFLEDGTLGRVGPDFTRPANFFSGKPQADGPPVTQARLRRYRDLCRSLGLEKGIEGYDDKGQIFLIASATGLLDSGSDKGYAFVRRKPDVVVDNLDGFTAPSGKVSLAFRHISDGWYLYLNSSE